MIRYFNSNSSDKKTGLKPLIKYGYWEGNV